MVGIDRVLLKDLDIKQFDKEILKINNFIVIDPNDRGERILKDRKSGEYVAVNYIKVSKNNNSAILITGLRIGIMEIEGIKGVEYEHLEATLPTVISKKKINDKNINNTEDLKKALAEIENELKILGFGEVDLLSTEIKEIEINKNIKLKNEFKDYKDVLEYIRGLLPNRMKSIVNCSHEPKGIYTGFQVGNGSINLKMYDKKTNIANRHNKEIDSELMRVEYTLLNEEKVKSVLGTNQLLDIEQDFNIVPKAFNRLLADDLVNRIYKDIDRQIKHAVRTIKRYKKDRGISAIDRYLKNYQADLIDVEIILVAHRETERPDHYSRQSKKAIKSAKEIEGKNLFGNINKLNELLESLGYEKIVMNMTNGIKKEVKKEY